MTNLESHAIQLLVDVTCNQDPLKHHHAIGTCHCFENVSVHV